MSNLRCIIFHDFIGGWGTSIASFAWALCRTLMAVHLAPVSLLEVTACQFRCILQIKSTRLTQIQEAGKWTPSSVARSLQSHGHVNLLLLICRF